MQPLREWHGVRLLLLLLVVVRVGVA